MGYGPTGALLAALLGARGHRVLVAERAVGVHPLPRAIHFDAPVMRVLQAAGLGDSLDPLAVPGLAYEFVDRRGRLLFRIVPGPDEARHGWPSMNLFRQPDLERALRHRVAHTPGVTVREGAEVVGLSGGEDGVTLGMEGPGGPAEARARWLVGCDGAGSMVRHLAGLPSHPSGPPSAPWLVVDARLNGPESALPRALRQTCDPRHPTTYVPRVGTPERRWEFLLRPGEDAEAALRPERVQARLAPHLGANADRLEIERAATYHFQARLARRWRRGRVLLAGDAAHTMPPFAGQGLGAGLRDAHALAWRLDLVLRGRASPALLDSYPAERRPHARAVTRLAVLAGYFVTLPDPAARLRDALFALAHRAPALSYWLGARMAAMPPLRRGLFYRPRRGLGCPRAVGTLLPQPRVRAPGGARLDGVLGGGFALVGWGVDPRAGLGWRDLAFWAGLGGRAVRVVPRGPRPRPAPGLVDVEDAEGVLAAWFRRAGARVALVRPDLYVYGLAAEASPLVEALRGHLGEAPAPLPGARAFPRPALGKALGAAALLGVALGVRSPTRGLISLF